LSSLIRSNTTLNSVAVYTTYCGSLINKTFNPSKVSAKYAHYFVSNNENVLMEASQLGWIPIYIDLQVSEDPILSSYQAKIAKALPHLIPQLNDYDFTLYRDDKINVSLDELDNFIIEFVKNNSSLAVRPHPFLSGNILFEFGEAMLQSRYKSEWTKTVKYITEKVKNGQSLECQMYHTCLILRNMKHSDTKLINEDWYQQIQLCGIECQISFDFIAQNFSSISLLPIAIDYGKI